jgi:dTDP-4-dehydrorhamnose reductase
MRVLVVGRLGQVGTELALKLPAAGHETLSLEPPELDLLRPETVRACLEAFRPEVVVNAAAYTAVDKAEDDSALAHAINRDGTALLGRETARIGVPMVHFSTDYVFAGDKAAPYVEGDPVGPVGVYGASKLAGDLALAAANPRHVVLRTAWVCSAHGGNFVKTMLRLGRERAELGVVADQLGAPSFADDLADAVVALLPRLVAAPAGDAGFGTFHLTGQPFTSWHGFAAAIFAGAAARGAPTPVLRAITTADYPTRARRPANSRLDCSRIAAVHGVRAADWRVSLDRCLGVLLS